MSHTSFGAQPSENLPEDRLDSWKEIAAYLNRDITTVQRWEKREGMPVHRHRHDRIGSVYASRAELDAWSRSRNPRTTSDTDTPITPPATVSSGPRRRLLLSALAIGFLLVIAGAFWLYRTEFFWRSPIANARFQQLTDFDGAEQSATISRDGHFVAFLSDRDGQMDIWLTRVGSGQFHNLTSGSVPDLVNPSVRSLGFSPDGSLVTFWVRRKMEPPTASRQDDISIWAVPILGGQPRPYLEGVAEFDWSPDAARLVYHTPGPGDPMYVTDASRRPTQPIFTASAGLHSHFPLWSADAGSIFFVQGSLPDKLDIWRISPTGGTPERITAHQSRVSYPVLLDRRTLLYLATEPDGAGPWLYSLDLSRRIPHRLTTGPERYTSLAASADARHLVLTVAAPKKSLWTLPLDPSSSTAPQPVSLTTSSGSSPRLGPGFLLYVSSTGSADTLWKRSGDTSTQLWSGEQAQFIGGPAVSRDGANIAFAIRQQGQKFLYTLRADGTNARVISSSLDIQGDPAWAPDGKSLTAPALDHGVPHLFRVPLDGSAPSILVSEYSLGPAWASDGSFVLYSGPDVGTEFNLRAANSDATARTLPVTRLSRGARHVAFVPGTKKVLLLRGDLQHKNLWIVDVESGAEQQLTNFGADFDIRDFDISPDGRQLILEHVQEKSNIVLVDLP